MLQCDQYASGCVECGVKDLFEATFDIIKAWTSYQVPPHILKYAVVLAFLVSGIVPIYLTIRRWRGDFKAISSELDAASKLIAGQTNSRLNAVAERLEANLAQRFDAIHTSLALKSEVIAQSADTAVESEPQAVKQQGGYRIKSAVAVRDTVMKKWLEGRDLKASLDQPYSFRFEGFSEAGNAVILELLTPYRLKIGQDGRLPFALDVWVDGYKKLNFEWDADGNYALRGFKRGDWIEDLAEWHLTPANIVKQAVAA
jgi:hypothetical protein